MKETKSLGFKESSPEWKVLARWHTFLADHDRGGRAELRRAASPGAVALAPAYHRLLRSLEEAGFAVGSPRYRERLAAVAGLAARVEEHRPGAHVAQQLGKPKKESSAPPVSRLRFARLVAVEDLDELYGKLARLLPLVDNRVNLCDLARSVLYWNEDTRRRWAYDYYRVAPERQTAEA